MLTTTRRCCSVLFLLATCCSSLGAQSAQPTVDILFRTLMIKYKHEAGTMFSVDVDNREYWLTAKHILTGRTSGPAGVVNQKEVTLEVLDPIGDAIRWNPVRFTVIDPGKDIDIVVLVPETKIRVVDIPSLKAASGNFGMGSECSFLGFPYASTSTADWQTSQGTVAYKMPFIKHCYISGMISKPIPILVLDGINNPGFSGGPVLYNTGPNQVVIGVISGYHVEPTEVHTIEVPNISTEATAPKVGKINPNGEKKEEVVDINSGIILAYPISEAVSAIKKNPIGRPILSK